MGGGRVWGLGMTFCLGSWACEGKEGVDSCPVGGLARVGSLFRKFVCLCFLMCV